MTEQSASREELDAILRLDFLSFLQRAFKEVEPGATLALANYLRLLCFHLEHVAAGKTRRLIINMPPRHLKTSVTSIIWVAWLLANDPSKKIAIICHNNDLVTGIAPKCKRLFETPWYRRLAPYIRIREDRDRTKDFETSAGGNVFVTTVEAGITGRGFDIIILDDPQSAQSAMSEVERDRLLNVFDESISSRLDDQVRGAIVLVQQRLHEDDLTGKLTARGGWTRLSLPLVAPEDTTHAIDDFRWIRKAGDVICPERLSVEHIPSLQAEKGARVFQTQWQQSPSTATGEIIKPEHLPHVAELPKSANQYFVSVDTASKALGTSDYTVFLVIASDGTRHFIIDVIRSRYDVTEMRDIACRLHDRFRIGKFLIEDSAAGPGLQALMKERGCNAEILSVGNKDKIARLEALLHFFVDGRIFIFGDAPWTAVFRDELVRFPMAKYDDQVDALTLYLSHMSSRQIMRPVVCGADAASAPQLSGVRLRKGDHPLRPRTRAARALFRR